ncbi:cyclin-domain-containing protein [Lipomyces arxii]|uniref:cyclin-domain-containing protein n=1 Tax=Lipomyces arxii TaxID=56418 RepID=UPI0034CE79AF
MSASILVEQYRTSSDNFYHHPQMSKLSLQPPSMTDIQPADALRLLSKGINRILDLADPAQAAWQPPLFFSQLNQQIPLSPPLNAHQSDDQYTDSPSPMMPPLAPAVQDISPADENPPSLTPPHQESESQQYLIDKANQRSIISRRFWSKSAPEIDIERYLSRIHKYCPISTAVYLSTLLYIYRLCVLTKSIPLTQLNVHRLVIAALRVACKNLEDINHPQKRFAKVGGMTEQELCRLEIGFLFLMDFDLKVNQEVLEAQVALLMELEQQD